MGLIINTFDIRQIISYLPLKSESEDQKYNYQMKSLVELDELLAQTFNKDKNITFNDFITCIGNKADIFLLLFCYLHMAIPILDKKLTIYRKKNSSIKHLISTLSSPSSDKFSKGSPNSVNIAFSPYRSTVDKPLYISPSLFSPLSEYRLKHKVNSTNNNKNSMILRQLSKKSINTNSSSKNLEKLIVSDSPDTPITKSLKTIGAVKITQGGDADNKKSKDEVQGCDYLTKPEKSVTIYNETNLSATSFLKAERHNWQEIKKNSNELSSLVRSNNTITENPEEFFKSTENNMEPTTKDFKETGILEVEEEKEQEPDQEKDLKESIKYSGELLKIGKKTQKLKLVFLRIIDQFIYYYRSKDDNIEDYKKAQYLPGSFIREYQKENIEGTGFHSFSIIFPSSNVRFYHTDRIMISEWISNLRDTISYKNFFEFFKMGDTIGKGQFGIIKSGVDLKTKEKIAIKILTKSAIKRVQDWSLIRTEIDIMKHSKHPSIIKFLDHYENSDYIFIVMELLNYGTLQNYLEKKEFNISEKRAANIAFQIADALDYLHKYGIIHRDLKPENILINKKGNKHELKLMDFGLSKIIGKDEKANEGCGTMAFASPEILSGQPYDTSVDIWSLGVIIYYIVSGEIPFLPKSRDYDDMKNNIKNHELTFSIKFKGRSKEVRDIIRRCMEKKPENRIKIDELIKHEWFRMNLYI